MEAAVVVVSWNRTMETVELEVFVKTMAVPLTVTIVVAIEMALGSIIAVPLKMMVTIR